MNTTEIISKLLLLSEEKQKEVYDFIDFLVIREYKNNMVPPRKRIAGTFEGKIQIMPGFDDPIEGMEEYYQ